MPSASESFTLYPIGHVIGGRSEAEDDDWDSEIATIELDPAQFEPEAILGLDEFSHLEVIFLFDRVDSARVERGARHPRGNTDWPRVGIFAQRAKDRPNRIGVSICRILKVEDLEIQVAGLDAIDGTPILDLKPYMQELAPRSAVAQPQWSRELMIGYWHLEG